MHTMPLEINAVEGKRVRSNTNRQYCSVDICA